ncbi:nitroreductase family deazaflavin-dependent oxidoreductase [Streptomyces sp. NPDC059556]|uniref:nitroreductase family deazaflavin-dependent oxidoreductase n=1 Tax=Streptomyces sp. NPDC059556 TaxID=3346863 RepID=UPI0036744C80
MSNPELITPVAGEPGDYNIPVVQEFRTNGGKVGGMFEGAPLVLLTHTGAKSGRRRVCPVMYVEEDGRTLVFATNAGGPQNPSWYHNVLVNSEVTVETGTEVYRATAVVVEGAERDRLYAESAEKVPALADYQSKTERRIPVVAVRRLAD